MVFRLRTITITPILMFSLAPMLMMAHALYSRPSSPLSLQTQNEFLDNLTPIQNVQNAKDQSHDEIEKEVREWITDEVSIKSNIVIIQCRQKITPL